jgi:hypothetical protein
MTVGKSSRFSRVGLPVKVGLVFASLAMLLAVVGIVRGMVPSNPLSIFLALLISGVSWGLVSWAVTTAAVDVERDLEDEGADSSELAAQPPAETSNGEA